MIKLKFQNLPAFEIKPTIFPDGTSQVWKIEDWMLDGQKFVKIEWYYEQEAELIWVNQLICLLYQLNIEIYELFIPYLPYGRQDKEVSNTSTFAKHVFLEMLLKEHVGRLSTLDAHSEHPAIINYNVEPYIQDIINDDGYDCVIFPDAGASDRYTSLNAKYYIVLDKVRDQLTGVITGLAINQELSTLPPADEPINALICDDICDGGMSFIKSAEYLFKQYDQMNIGLYVTHGIFSKGVDVIYDSGIHIIYCTDSLTSFHENKQNMNILDSVDVIII